MREVVDKDSFIKEFLLSRVKDIGSLSFDQLITTIHRHFTPEQQEQDVQTEQEVLDREMQTDWEEVEEVESEDSLEALESIVIMEPADEGLVIMEKGEDQPTMEEVEEPLKEENIKQTATGEANLDIESKEYLEELDQIHALARFS